MGAIAQIVKSLEGFDEQQSEYCKEDQRGGIGFTARIEPDGQGQSEQQRSADQHLIHRRWQGHALLQFMVLRDGIAALAERQGHNQQSQDNRRNRGQRQAPIHQQ